jgi:DNA topoisomerase-2
VRSALVSGKLVVRLYLPCIGGARAGSHIKGLFINFLHRFWPSLLERGYVEEFITPIVKATKGAGNKKSEKVFFAIPEYERWKEELDPAEKAKWRIKYYKGLGTNTTEEGKEYFKALAKHRIAFEWQGQEDGQLIDMAFSKDKVEARKQWLLQFYEDQKQRVANHQYDVPLYSEDLFKDGHESRAISYSDFINKVFATPPPLALGAKANVLLCWLGRAYTI